jgi:tRNA threonylcarbamoyl adenosine modification protein (Sua5/YciO/YrdC/YwlC family)
MLIRIHPDNPQPRQIQSVVECMRKGGVIIYPTDTVYGIGCDINSRKAVERVCQIRGIKPEKATFSFICSDLSNISEYCSQIDNAVFKLMKSVLPGPYTFILGANSRVPKMLHSKRHTVGIRIPDNRIPLAIVQELGNPIMTASLRDDDDLIEYGTDPELIHERYGDMVDMVIDGGYGGLEASTVLDCADGDITLVREGKGPIDFL